MKAIFYDLETSDREPIGQILNYSFIAVDETLRPIGECSGDIRLSRLQLPSPEAILKNRVDVLALQASSAPAEPEALQRIAAFIAEVQKGEKSPPVLIGFNSNKFDLLRVRTSMIRNGINPYFGGNIVYRDVFNAVRALAIREHRFPLPTKVSDRDGSQVRSLSLESITRELGILAGVQSHHSRDDVLLTIELARALREKFGLDVCSYDAFEIAAWMKQRQGPGIFWSLTPEYELASGNRARRTPMAFHHATHRYALFVDLEAYLRGDGRRSIRWYNMSSATFFSGGECPEGERVAVDGRGACAGDLAASARREFKDITADHFFGDSTCDIEQDIYRIDFQGINALGSAIWKNDLSLLKKSKARDLDVLFVRYRLMRCKELDESARKALRKYALYRYGGKLQLSKSSEEESSQRTPELAARPIVMHPTLSELLARIDELARIAAQQQNQDDSALLASLRAYYMASDIVSVAGEELLGKSQAAAA